MFSAALGLAGSAFKMIGASNAAKAQAAATMHAQAVQERMALKQHELNLLNMGAARDRERDLREENAYQRTQETIDRRITENERRFAEKELLEYKNVLKQERLDTETRQIKEDAAAARERAFVLSEILKNQDLRGEERDFAISELRKAQDVASDERVEDRLRLADERATLSSERDFAREAYENTRSQRIRDREAEGVLRERVLTELDGLSADMDIVTDEFLSAGDILSAFPSFDEADLAGEEARRTQLAFEDIDRARIGDRSELSAAEIRRGMDTSTAASMRGRDMTRQYADLYAKARQTARDDALKYIQGRQTVGTENLSQRLGLRNTLLSQAAVPAQASLESLLRLPALPSGVQELSALPTGVQDRDLVSALNYRAPVAIDSSVYDRLSGQTGGGLAQYLNPRSAAVSEGVRGIQSGILPPRVRSFDPSSTGLRQAASLGQQQLMDAAGQNYRTQSGLMKDAAAGVGTAMGQLATEGGGVLDMLGKKYNWVGMGEKDSPLTRQNNSAVNQVPSGWYKEDPYVG